MRPNPYHPQALPLLTDNCLLKTLRHYRELEEALEGSAFPSIQDMHAQILDAIAVIEDELVRRSCDACAAESETESAAAPTPDAGAHLM